MPCLNDITHLTGFPSSSLPSTLHIEYSIFTSLTLLPLLKPLVTYPLLFEESSHSCKWFQGLAGFDLSLKLQRNGLLSLYAPFPIANTSNLELCHFLVVMFCLPTYLMTRSQCKCQFLQEAFSDYQPSSPCSLGPFCSTYLTILELSVCRSCSPQGSYTIY